ncbi:hypothetical protein FPOAC2_09608 [Fusarium poae]
MHQLISSLNTTIDPLIGFLTHFPAAQPPSWGSSQNDALMRSDRVPWTTAQPQIALCSGSAEPLHALKRRDRSRQATYAKGPSSPAHLDATAPGSSMTLRQHP